jgi:DNA-binding CsgD family transcriptional regulator
MVEATANDLRAVIAAMQEVRELDEPAATTAGLSALFTLVPCDFSAATWLNPGSGIVASISWPPAAVPERLRAEPAVIAAHPLAARLAGGERDALRISDVLDDRQWRNHPVRHQMAEVMGTTGGPLERELGWGVHTGAALFGYAVNRCGRDFDLRDRDIVSLLAPAFAQHRRLLIERAAARALLAAPTNSAVDAIVLDPAERIEHAWGAGEELYTESAASDAASPRHGRSTAAGIEELPAHDLPVGYRLLVLRGRSQQLAPREVLVLDLISRGFTADAIARRVGGSPRTVQKHLEHVYRKLDVHDRASAVRVALRAGLLPFQ